MGRTDTLRRRFSWARLGGRGYDSFLSDACLDPPQLHGVFIADLLQRLRTNAQASPDAAATTARAAIDADVAIIEHRSNYIGDAIIKEAERWQVDLIAMAHTVRQMGGKCALLGVTRTLCLMPG